VLPLYFTGTREVDEVGARNDFLGRAHKGKTLCSFGINPGGYIGFYDPIKNDNDQFAEKGDKRAVQRLKYKQQAKEARRSVRYRERIAQIRPETNTRSIIRRNAVSIIRK
jgi:hypothetical protein